MGQSDIMIVDDSPANLRMLDYMLRREGHAVRTFPLARLALDGVLEKLPDLILLDINMPDMNGYEMCEHLKSTKSLAQIPVIFLSARDESADRLKAFQSGGADYISKPFQFAEVHARVETHLKLRRLQQALTLQNEHLEELVAARTRDLDAALGRLTILDDAKNDFLQLISHEFRTPLNGILGAGSLMLEEMPSSVDTNVIRGIFDRGRRRMLSILDDALLLAQIDVSGEQFQCSSVSLHSAVCQGIEGAAEFAKSRDVTITPPPFVPGIVLANEDLLVRALHALIETAVKFAEKGHAIRLGYGPSPDSLDFVIESDNGQIPSSVLDKFFEIFSIGESITPGGDLGLGPPVACRILSLFGASVQVANREPAGIRLTICFKNAAPPPGVSGELVA